MSFRVPFHRMACRGKELEYLADVCSTGQWCGDKSYGKRVERWLESRLRVQRVLLTPSCTAALEMMALLLELKPGDEVVMPSFTFPTTASAVALRGATPVFAEIDPSTMNLDPDSAARALTPRTKAIMVVHYAGNACRMGDFQKLADSHGITLLEDAAQGIGASYRGRALGTLSSLGALSFHETKNIACGEGGALILSDPKFIARAEILREKGTNRSQFLRGEVDKYTWRDVGSSYVMSEFSAAVLWAQLERLDEVTEERRTLWLRYLDAFSPLEKSERLALPKITDGAVSNGHIFWLRLRDVSERDALQNHLKSKGVQSTFHFVPLHSSDAGRNLGRPGDQLELTEAAADQILRLPMYSGLGVDQGVVVDAVLDFFKGH